jgi:hypothetical protein
MSQNNFRARHILPDYVLYGVRNKKDVEERVYDELAVSLARELVKHKCEEITIKREVKKGDPYLNPWEQGILYELDCFVLSRAEWKEYQDLLEFQKKMQKFVNVGEI